MGNEENAELIALRSAVETMTRVWQVQDRAANEGRRKLYDKFDLFREEVREKMSAMASQVNDMAKQMAEIQPSIKEYNAEKLRDEGASGMKKYIAGFVLTGAGGVGWAVHELITWFSHR